MNARYYDPQLGMFLSPDTVVPDVGAVIDYNRFLYARGNPVKYTDPSGHCATTKNGKPDMENDGECWQMANSIAGLGYTEQGFHVDWGDETTPDWWLSNIANQSFATVEYLTPFYERYQNEFEGRTGLRPPVSLEPVVNPEVHLPGEGIVKAVVKDVAQCGRDFPWGCAKAADDAATVVAGGGALVCAAASGGACLGVVSGASTIAGIAGTGITTRNAVVGEATWVDVAVSVGTTAAGRSFGTSGQGLGGAGISLIQRLYDQWSGNR
jgi:hypothetical protein